MKKIQILTATFLITSSIAFSQSIKHQSNNHTQILKLGVNTFFDTDEFPFSISWEKKVATNQSIQIGFLPRFRTYDDDKTSGIGFNFAYRKYISKNRKGINGLFISPIVKLGFLNQDNNFRYYVNGNPSTYVVGKNTDRITQFSGGLVFGHNWVYRSGFSFEVSGGIAYYNSTNKNTNSGNNYPYINYNQAGILPQFQFGLGYAF
jgi:hypothetical protein